MHGNSKHKGVVLRKCAYCAYVKKQILHYLYSAIYGLPIFDFFIYLGTCVRGRLLGKTEFDDLFAHYQYAYRTKAQYEHGIVNEMMHAIQNT